MIKKEKIPGYSRSKVSKSIPEYKFASRLKALMKEKKITQEQLSKMMSVSLDTVKQWCQGYAFPEELNLGTLCTIFKPYSVDYFHGVIDDPSYDTKFIMEYTGLSAAAVTMLHSLKEDSEYTERIDNEAVPEVTEIKHDADLVQSEDRAKGIIALLNELLNWNKSNSNDELLSLMAIFIQSDIQNIAMKSLTGEFQSGFPGGEITATDSAGRVYRIQTANIVKTQLEQPIINGLREIAKRIKADDQTVHYLLPDEMDVIDM